MAVGTLAAWRRGDGALTLALLAMTAMAGVAVAVLTAVTSHPGTYPVDQDGQVLVTVLLAGWWLILAELARSGALAGRVLGAPLSGLVPVAGWAIAVKAVAVDALALGPHGPALGYAAAALAGAALVTLYRPPATGGDWPDGVPMITGLAVLGAIMAGSDAIVAGSDDATRAVFSLATAAGLGLACAIRHRGPRDVRRLLVVGAILTGVLAESVAVVTLLTPHTGTVDRSAQLGLSIAWAATAIALIAVGLVARGELASTARRSGIPLLGVAIAKVLLYDTARLSIGQRAGLFLAIGGLLLVGAYLYARLVALTRDDAAGSERPAAA